MAINEDETSSNFIVIKISIFLYADSTVLKKKTTNFESQHALKSVGTWMNVYKMWGWDLQKIIKNFKGDYDQQAVGNFRKN